MAPWTDHEKTVCLRESATISWLVMPGAALMPMVLRSGRLRGLPACIRDRPSRLGLSELHHTKPRRQGPDGQCRDREQSGQSTAGGVALYIDDDTAQHRVMHHTRLRVIAAALLTATLASMAAGPTVAAADTVAPVASAPRAVLRSSAAVTAAGIPMRASWTASDPSGIARYEVQARIDGGSWAAVGLASPSARTARIRVPSPHEAQLRVRATDGAGNRARGSREPASGCGGWPRPTPA